MNKMRNFIAFFALIAVLASCGSDATNKEGAVVQATIKNADNATIYLEDINGSTPIAVDTVVLKGDKATLNADVVPGLYRIKIGNSRAQSPIILFLDNESNLKVSFDANEPMVYAATGSKEAVAINEALNKQNALITSTNEIRKQMQSAQPAQRDSLNQVMQTAISSTTEYMKAQLESGAELNPHVNAVLLNLLNPQQEAVYIRDQLKTVLEKDKESRFIKAMGQRYGLIAGGQQPQQQPTGLPIGEEVPNIAQANPEGEVLELADLKGKYVLIDFWASWCKPCRRENPNVVKTYAKYKDQGFEIFSVSLDKSKDRWVQAIKDDGLTWDYHVSDLKAWRNEANRPYGVSSIPATFLIDPEGKLIARNLRGPALEAKLAEVFSGS